MDRMQEEGFYLRRFNNGSPAKRSDIYANLAAEWWSTFGQLVERRKIIIPNDEKLIAQLTSRRKLYDSKGRAKLESKADLRSRGIESPDRPVALIGASAIATGRTDWAPVIAAMQAWRQQQHPPLFPDSFLRF
jgi:phage terminase large subunit